MGSPNEWTKSEWMKEALGVIMDTGEAVAGSIAGAAGQKRADVAGDKESSWMRPSTSISDSPVHVGSIFFRTKDSSLGSEEEGLLEQLAKAYSAYARRNIQNPRGQKGLKGSVVGYADPRPSAEPDNEKLSSRRAEIVARRLTGHLARESNLINGDFDITVTAGGALRADHDDAKSLASLRRVDIFLTGGVMAQPAPVPAETKGPETKEPESKPKAPPLDELEKDNDWDRYNLDGANHGDIRAMAVRVVSAVVIGGAAGGGSHGNSAGSSGGLEGEVQAIWKAIGLYVDLHHRSRRREFPDNIDPIKPGWWDGLYTPTKIRPGQTAGDSVLEDKAKRLKTWYLTTIRFRKTYIAGPGKVLEEANAEIRKDDPDPDKMRTYREVSQVYMYMVRATGDLAQEVMKLLD
jgi:outer membrane protein OmpA-like peptidoglycan-associated protein